MTISIHLMNFAILIKIKYLTSVSRVKPRPERNGPRIAPRAVPTDPTGSQSSSEAIALSSFPRPRIRMTIGSSNAVAAIR